jgi:hypothetical protein
MLDAMYLTLHLAKVTALVLAGYAVTYTLMLL